MKSIWEDTRCLHKFVAILTIFMSLSVVALAVLQILEVWTEAVKLCIPFMGITMFCQAYLQWGTNRSVAYFSIVAATFSFACTRAFLLC